MINYKDLCDYIKSNKINSGDKVLIPVGDKDIEFIVLNNPKADCKLNLMSSISLIKDNRWKDNYSHNKNFKNVKFLHFKESDLNKELQSYYQLLPEFIRDRLVNPRIRELLHIDLFSNEVSFDYLSLDRLWIPSASQVYGNSGFSNDDILDQQFDYFVKSDNRILHDENGKAVEWWLRSVNVPQNNTFYVTECGALANCEPVFKRDAPICFTIICK